MDIFEDETEHIRPTSRVRAGDEARLFYNDTHPEVHAETIEWCKPPYGTKEACKTAKQSKHLPFPDMDF